MPDESIPRTSLLVTALLLGGCLAAQEQELDVTERPLDACTELSAPVYHRVNPTSGASLYTLSSAEATGAVQYGFTDDRGVAFKASASARAGTSPVYRLFSAAKSDFLWTLSEAERVSAKSTYGYADQGIYFHLPVQAGPCLVAVHRYALPAKGMHRFAVTDAQRSALLAAGWVYEGVVFYAASATTTPPPPPPPPPPPAPADPLSGPSVAGLDDTGNVIPDTSYAVPSGAVFMATNGRDDAAGTQAAPVKTLARALALVPANGTIVVRGGVYRDGVAASSWKVFNLQAYPHEQPWFDGTDVVTGWVSNGRGQWSVPWSTPHFCNGQYYERPWNQQTAVGPCAYYDQYYDTVNPASADPQMVFKDGVYVHEVTRLDQAVGDNFYYDQVNRRLYLGFDPAGRTVELAQRTTALALEGGPGGNRIQGLGFRRYATNQLNMNRTHGAVLVGMPGVRVEHCVFTQMAGAGLLISDPRNVVAYRNVFAKNGHNGLDANGHQKSGSTPDNLLLEGNVFNGNNTERFGVGSSYSTDAAGSKLCHMNGFALKNNLYKNGVLSHGFWCDMACSKGVMTGNVFAKNAMTGLFYEISDTGLIANNLMYGNGEYGLKLGSANTKVFNNTLVDNRFNALIYDDTRSPNVDGWTDAGPDTVNVQLVNNLLSANQNMVQAWRTGTLPQSTGPSTFFSVLDSNSYYRPNGVPARLYEWRDSGTTVFYNSCAALSAARGWERRCQDLTSGAEPFFQDATKNDYRVRASSLAYLSGAPLPSDVAAAMGLSAGQVVSRGALRWLGN
ncbi:MAG: right-handed parallel beta-helix repeat-containing protein [Archangiaceae bacterium]|nr:right-handed parallel beta-helix repeat-containing protein [Archangiaceae bacterium]